MASPFRYTGGMTRQREGPGLTVRPPGALKDQAKELLTKRGRGIQAFVVACLSALLADPDRVLALLEPHWPPPRLRGRPRKPPENVPDSP